MANTIFIGPAEQQPEVLERAASERILPGQFVVEVDGEFQLLNDSTGGVVYIALENLLDDTADAYELGDSIQAAKVDSGQYYQSILEGGRSVSYGDPLVVNSASILTHAATGDDVICNADEQKTTDSESAFVRVFFSKNFIQGAITSWYNKSTGMINCSDSLIQCNEELIQCL